jgi:hypothetical protein
VVSRRILPALQSSHSFCARFYRWAEQTNTGGKAGVDLRATQLWLQGRLFERKNISVPENALIAWHLSRTKVFPRADSIAASNENMNHVSPATLWTYGCRANALNDVELEHVLTCVECERLLGQIEETLDEIAHERSVQIIN